MGGRLGGLASARCPRPPTDTECRADVLTGLYSPEAAIETLTRQIHLADRLKHPLTVLLVEIDAAAMSSPQPDAVVREVAACLTRRVRKYDVLCRWQQASFLVISPDSDVGGALVLAQDLVDSVGQASMVGPQGAVAISVGVHSRRAQRPGQPPELAREMVAAAMRALEVSVAHGAGRIEIEP